MISINALNLYFRYYKPLPRLHFAAGKSSENQEKGLDLETFKLYDAISASERNEPFPKIAETTITVNDEPMIREKVKMDEDDDDDDDAIYDLYYSRQDDFDDRNFEHCVRLTFRLFVMPSPDAW